MKKVNPTMQKLMLLNYNNPKNDTYKTIEHAYYYIIFKNGVQIYETKIKSNFEKALNKICRMNNIAI